jgi:thymidine kinase
VTVVVAGCDIDHFGDLFAPFDALLPRADERVHKTGTCARCGAPSTHSERLVATTERIIVGGSAEFIATCAKCFRQSRR